MLTISSFINFEQFSEMPRNQNFADSKSAGANTLHIDGTLKKFTKRRTKVPWDIFHLQYASCFLRGIISIDYGAPPEYFYSCCVSNHVYRDGDSCLADDIEEYDSPILLIDSDDESVLKLPVNGSTRAADH